MRAAPAFSMPEDAKSRTLEVASANWHATAALIATAPRRCAARRCGHHHDRPHPDQGRRGRRAWRHRCRAADRRRASLYRRGAHAGDGDSPQRTLQGSRAADRRGALRHHGRCLAAHRRSSRRRRPLSQRADQRGKSAPESAARLARMLGRDESEAELGEWVALARYFADCQLAEIEAGGTRSRRTRDALTRARR